MRYFQVKTVQGERRTSGQGYYDYSRNKFVLPNGRSVHSVQYTHTAQCFGSPCHLNVLYRRGLSTISVQNFSLHYQPA